MADGLSVLAQGVLAWLAPQPGHGRPNAGVVVDADGITVIDTLLVPSQWEPFAEAVESFGLPIRRIVLSSSHIPYVGGSARFREAAVYGTRRTSDLLDLPANVAGYRRLYPELAAELDDELVTRPVTHTVDVAAATRLPGEGPSRGNSCNAGVSAAATSTVWVTDLVTSSSSSSAAKSGCSSRYPATFAGRSSRSDVRLVP